MLHTTFRKAWEAGACSSKYNKMAKALGRVKEYGRDTPVPLDKVLDICGLDAALWCLCCVIEPAEREIRLLACDFAEHTLSIFEEKYPDDKRPHKAIEISRKFAEGEATREDLAAAGTVAWAILDAAWAAWAVARDAALEALDAACAARAAAWAAGAVAWVARDARAVAWAVARDAALAAGDAERQWQEQKFREMLNNSGI